MRKKLTKVVAALAAIALLLPIFAAYEAHVINVKAHIEKALSVQPKSLNFGTTFPQERLEQQFSVALSKSFREQKRVKDVNYQIVQKRKLREIPKLDVVFAFDLTGSMSGALATAKARSKDIMDLLSAVSPDVQFGVMTHVDYPGTYTSYGYTALYGDPLTGDYAYKLDKPLTADKAAVKGVIDGLVTYFGGDGPQNYTRIMYESYADAGVGWRAGTEQAVIMLNDNVPHDNDLNAGVPGKIGGWSTGGDPGRDEIILNADDLDLQTELANMVTNGKTLYALRFAGGTNLDYWKHWTGLTGGDAVESGDYADIVEAIKALFLYPDLRPFLTKGKKPETDVVADTEDAANLDQSLGDIVDDWKVILNVPCISPNLCQDHNKPPVYDSTGKLISGCPTYPCGGDPSKGCQSVPEKPPGSGDAGDFGADLWIEVTGFSYF